MKKILFVTFFLLSPILVFAQGNSDASQIQNINSLLEQKASTLGKQSLDNSQSNEIKSLLEKRKNLLIELAKNNPSEFLNLVLPKSTLSTLSVKYKDYIEEEITGNATVDVVHVDDFKNPENSYFEYSLTVPKKSTSRISLKSLNSNPASERLDFYPTEDLYIVSNTKVNIKGYKLQNLAVANTGSRGDFDVLQSPKPDAVGEQKVLVLLTEMQGYASPITIAEVEKAVFGDDSPFQKFYKEQSYNKTWFSGKAYKINLDRTLVNNCRAGVDINDQQVATALKDQNINLSLYDRVLFVPPIGYCSGVGKQEYAINGVRYNLSSSSTGWGDLQAILEHGNIRSTLSHEIGHGLGVMHANAWRCNDGSTLYGSCSHAEYGNWYDIMGAGQYSTHFNAYYKELLGWITPATSLIIDRTGRYTITALETSGGKVAGKIQIANGKFPYYIEARRAIGFDSALKEQSVASNQQGIFINHIIDHGKDVYIQNSRLLDMSPEDSDQRVTLNGNNIFKDSGRGVSVGPIVGFTKDSVTFDVSFGRAQCVRREPSVKNLFHADYIASGDPVGIHFTLLNNNYVGCGSGIFKITPILPVGWTVEEVPSDVTLESDEERRLGIVLKSNDANPGTYSIGMEVSQGEDGQGRIVSISRSDVKVLARPVITSIEPQPVIIGEDIRIIGKGFSQKNRVVISSYEGKDIRHAIFETVSPISLPELKREEQALIIKMPITLCKWMNKGPVCSGDFPTLTGGYYVYLQTDRSISNQLHFQVKNINDISRIEVISPAFEEVIEKGKQYTIRYKVTEATKLKIELMDSKGIKVLKTINPSAEINAFREYYWDVPSDIDFQRDDLFTIRISDATNPKISAKSAKFRISERNEPDMLVIPGTLSLEYDNNQKESSLVSKTKVKVTAHKDADLIITENYSFGVYAYGGLGQWMYGNTSYSSDALKVAGIYRIKKGTSAIFDLTTRFNVKIMFAGSYFSSVGGFSYGQNHNSYKDARPNSSNSIVIIGETSPYINTIFSNPSPPLADTVITVAGERFGSGVLDVNINGKKLSLPSKKFAAYDSVSFVPKELGIEDGLVSVQITHPTEGQSNIYSFEIGPTKLFQEASVMDAIKNLFKSK